MSVAPCTSRPRPRPENGRWRWSIPLSCCTGPCLTHRSKLHSMAHLRFLSDEQLLAECRLEAHRGSGPGGQKRQKTSNAIRLTHLPSGIGVVAGESRSAAENKLR